MGAISSPASLPLLRAYLADPNENVSVRETCEIALAKIEWDHSEEGQAHRRREQQQPQQPAAFGGAGLPFMDAGAGVGVGGGGGAAGTRDRAGSLWRRSRRSRR